MSTEIEVPWHLIRCPACDWKTLELYITQDGINETISCPHCHGSWPAWAQPAIHDALVKRLAYLRSRGDGS